MSSAPPSSPRDGPYAPVHTDERDHVTSWDDDDDDEAGLSRYAMTDVPMSSSSSSWWATVRQQARQRRASQLLAWSEYSSTQRITSVMETYCCDATDEGILLVAIAMVLWWLLGRYFWHASHTYWILGMGILLVRLSARPLMERFQRTQQQRRIRASSDNMQMAEIV